MQFIHNLEYFVALHKMLAYGLFFAGIILEGEIVLIFAGIMTHIGVFHVVEIAPVLVGATIIKPIVWYVVGDFLLHAFPANKFLRFIERRIHSFLPHFREKPFWSIVSSKFIYGINHFMLLFCGYTKINFKKYMEAEFLSSALWLVGFFSLGYFFSYAAFSISHDIRNVILLVFLFILGYLLVQKFISLFIEYKEEA